MSDESGTPAMGLWRNLQLSLVCGLFGGAGVGLIATVIVGPEGAVLVGIGVSVLVFAVASIAIGIVEGLADSRRKK